MRGCALVLALLAGTVHAAPETSPRPIQRPLAEAGVADVAVEKSAPEDTAKRGKADTADRIIDGSMRPQSRPKALVERALQREKLRQQGAVCGNPDVKGDEVGTVRSQVQGCGISGAVRVRSVSGVSLSPAALMNCKTALTLDHWVRHSALPRLSDSGGGLAGLRIVGHYSCRRRNNQPNGRISEHGKGNAIDIAEFRLKDGSTISVLNDWNSKKGFEPLREIHRDACGVFGTVLGPKADQFHLDHFHFDTARQRGGTYCR